MDASALHTPVMLARTLELLAPAIEAASAAGRTPLVVDGTLGMGGHTEAMLDAHPGLVVAGIDRDPDAIRLAGERLARFGGPWLAGFDFSAVDAFFAPVAFRIRTYGLDVGAGQAWVDHMLAHPAMREWERQALAEERREESHEAELAAAGVITADYRHG